MGIGELFVLAVGLSMDAFAVSVCKGLSLGCIRPKHMGLAGLWFGGFQALMPLIGYFLGRFFTDSITPVSYTHLYRTRFPFCWCSDDYIHRFSGSASDDPQPVQGCR